MNAGRLFGEFGRLDQPDRLFFLYILLRPAVWLAKVAQDLWGRR